MGYRTYIGEMPKREYNKIRKLTEPQLIEHYKISKGNELDGDDYWYKGVYEYGKSLYEFGKYTDFNPPKKSLKPFFSNKELMKRYDEYDFYVVTKEFLAYVISTYQEKIKSFYTEMYEPFLKESEFIKSGKQDYSFSKEKYTFDFTKISDAEQTAIFQMINHIRSMRIEWVQLTPYDLEDKTPEITTSWKYEYGIFELIRIYKSFDFKRKVMIYYGY